MRIVVLAAVLGGLTWGIETQLLAQEAAERVDKDVVKRIQDEGLNRSQAMATISHLTDVFGPRLTASPQAKAAADWTKNKLGEWKLENSHLEPWGPFGRGWNLERFSLNMVTPEYSPLIAYPKAWSPSTQRAVRGKPVYLDAKTEKDLDQYRGKLHRAIVFISPPREVKALFDPLAQRQSDSDLLSLANGESGDRRGLRARPADGKPATPAADPMQPSGKVDPPPPGASAEQRAAYSLLTRKWQLVHEEGAAAVIEPGRGDGGTVFVGAATLPTRKAQAEEASPATADGSAPAAAGQNAAPRRKGAWSADAPELVPQAVMAVEHYNRIVRMLQLGAPVELEVDIVSRFHTDDLMSYNIVAEIPGTDLKDEVVMLGAHFDSWHSGTGATDNAVGCGVALEAVRILKAIDAKPRRTIRIALWTGEEQGLLGSRAYVAEHFGRSTGGNRATESGTPSPDSPDKPAAGADLAAKADDQKATPPAETKPASEQQPATDEPKTAQPDAPAQPPAEEAKKPAPPTRYELKPDHAKLSAYFNLDNGAGKIRGIYLQRNEATRPIFRAWLAPFAEVGAATISLGNTGGTDHLAFDAVGLPGFQFIQDPLEYGTRTHHSSMDVFDRLIADDVKQAAVIMASFVYHAATRDEKLPRKPLQGEVVTGPTNPLATAEAVSKTDAPAEASK